MTAANGDGGIKFPSSLFEKNQYYVVSYKFKKIEGTLSTIGGHSSAFDTISFIYDGVDIGTSARSGIPVINDGNVHTV
jgi:hypothetical protein